MKKMKILPIAAVSTIIAAAPIAFTSCSKKVITEWNDYEVQEGAWGYTSINHKVEKNKTTTYKIHFNKALETYVGNVGILVYDNTIQSSEKCISEITAKVNGNEIKPIIDDGGYRATMTLGAGTVKDCDLTFEIKYSKTITDCTIVLIGE